MSDNTLPKNWKPFANVSQELLLDLKPYFAFQGKSREGRDYIAFSTEQRETTLLNGVEISASFRPNNYERPDYIYLNDLNQAHFDKMISDNSGSDLFYAKKSEIKGQPNTIISQVEYDRHIAHFDSK